ncbi:MAG: ParB/RepB/Spo0J family partition protein [Oscillospiraceae bacterium]|nr:ParB/RepB/Spo0J family partition protein [Oscillospiraceae bacterium]
MARPKRGLGKGLDALFIDNGTDDVAVSTLDIGEIEPNADQPRREFSPEALSQLADSIREHGILQPLVVRPRANGRYQIVAGERRWRAARIAGLSAVPVVVKELDDHQTLEIALVENLVREDLNPVEEALGYRTLADEFSMTQEQIASRVGKSRPAVANALRLLSLPEDVIELLKNGDLSPGHAKALLPLEKNASAAARQVIKDGLSVRQTEALVKKALIGQREAQKAPPSPSFYKETELALREALSRRVKVSARKDGKGELTIEFYSQEELKEFAAKLASK